MGLLATVAVSVASFSAVFAGIVVLNVLYQLVSEGRQSRGPAQALLLTAAQLAPKDPSRPPVVFHYVPIIGCAVSYGMDPYKFLFDARDKVRSFLPRADPS